MNAIMQRMFDLIVASVLLIISLPILLMVAVLVKLSSPGPVFFRQTRLGRGGKTFQILKFRSMIAVQNGGPSVTVAGDRRITPIGRILRRTKLDELPQLLNVVIGDMGLVGPRPEVPAYQHVYQNGFEKVLSARPGITDPVSLQLADEENFLKQFPNPLQAYEQIVLPRKLTLSLEYLQHRSIANDVQIIFLTVLAAAGLRRRHPAAFGDLAKLRPAI